MAANLAAVVTGPGVVGLQPAPVRDPRSDEVVVRIAYVIDADASRGSSPFSA